MCVCLVFFAALPLLQDFQQEMSQWRREPGQGRKKPKYSYRTVDELKAKGYAMGKSMAAPPTELAQVKVRGDWGPYPTNTTGTASKSYLLTKEKGVEYEKELGCYSDVRTAGAPSEIRTCFCL